MTSTLSNLRAVEHRFGLQIIPDKKEYTAGNTAELLVQAPAT
jgi:hypothetical protein